MRKLKRWRYYCDFCNKAGGSKRHMATHEAHCTLNPARSCRVCSVILQECQPTMDELKAAIRESFSKLKEMAHNCPACILAAQRQTPCDQWAIVKRDAYTYRAIDPNEDSAEWDFGAEMKRVMDEFRANVRDSY